MNVIKAVPFSLVVACLSSSCNPPAMAPGEAGLYDSIAFKDYWYAGKAEVNAYNLDQSRYGENRPGKAMLIFVTEGFSKSKQVKLDHPEAAGDDKVTVMKLNYTKNFVTGIYPYSMMLSAFTPVSRNQYPNTLKVTMSSQEWCGQVFSQMNLAGNQYEVTGYSYFEQEGDNHFKFDKTLLEDELFNLIRLDPGHIPLRWTSKPSRANFSPACSLPGWGTKTQCRWRPPCRRRPVTVKPPIRYSMRSAC